MTGRRLWRGRLQLCAGLRAMGTWRSATGGVGQPRLVINSKPKRLKAP